MTKKMKKIQKLFLKKMCECKGDADNNSNNSNIIATNLLI